jgi:tetratricopeptide (TPR) repeat protein
MEHRWDFRFAVPRPPEGGLVELSAVEIERLLLKRLNQEQANPDQAMGQLAYFYSNIGQPDKALSYWRQVLARQHDPETKARYTLAMGGTAEKAGDYDSAVRFYKEAMSLEPMSTEVWYWINNNLGFSLNTLGRFNEGEAYCRQAIQVDPGKPNAHKNLGLAMEGQGMLAEAAQCFITATRANASDARSLKHLEELLSGQPALAVDFAKELELCRGAVATAARAVAARQPVIYRGWRKHVLLWKSDLRAWLKRWVARRKDR